MKKSKKIKNPENKYLTTYFRDIVVFDVFYSTDLSDSVMLILSNFRCITRFTIVANTNVPTNAYI